MDKEALKKEIYALMRKYFPTAQRGEDNAVAEDCSEDELNEFIGMYWEYFCK